MPGHGSALVLPGSGVCPWHAWQPGSPCPMRTLHMHARTHTHHTHARTHTHIHIAHTHARMHARTRARTHAHTHTHTHTHHARPTHHTPALGACAPGVRGDLAAPAPFTTSSSWPSEVKLNLRGAGAGRGCVNTMVAGAFDFKLKGAARGAPGCALRLECPRGMCRCSTRSTTGRRSGGSDQWQHQLQSSRQGLWLARLGQGHWLG